LWPQERLSRRCCPEAWRGPFLAMEEKNKKKKNCMCRVSLSCVRAPNPQIQPYMDRKYLKKIASVLNLFAFFPKNTV
jgi:hypothetical protein